jgi:protein-S-isoprenylcysteine O-methyltransferase Ste14
VRLPGPFSFPGPPPGYLVAFVHPFEATMAVLVRVIVLWAYAAGFLVLTHLFVVLYEEPTLRRTFGEDYEAYCRRVRRWRPTP